MDFDAFRADPFSFLQDIAQSSNTGPDFGIKHLLESHFLDFPSDFDSLPLLVTQSDFANFLPGTLVRLRCIFVFNKDIEYFPLRLFNGTSFFTCLCSDYLPPEFVQAKIEKLVTRVNVCAISIPCLSTWLKGKIQTRHNPHFNDDDPVSSDDKIFHVIVKFAFDPPTHFGDIYDVVGFFSKTIGLPNHMPPIIDELPMLPRFFGFFLQNVSFIYSPISTSGFDFVSARMLTCSFLSQYFEESTVELLLLWFVSTSDSPIKLNLYGCSKQDVNTFAAIFDLVLTTFQRIEFSDPKFSQKKISPKMQNSILVQSDLILAKGTRVIIDETEFSYAQMSPITEENLEKLKELIDVGPIHYTIEGVPVKIDVSYPVLTLSTEKSFFFSEVAIKISRSEGQHFEILDDQLNVIRFYLDSVRYNKTNLSATGSVILESLVARLIRESSFCSQNQLRLLIRMFQLLAISYGINSLDEESLIANLFSNSVRILTSALS